MFLKFLRFKECFWKALFSCSVNGRPNRKDKAAFLIFFCLNNIIIFSTCSKTKLTGQAQSLKKLKKEAEAGLSDFSFATCKPKPCDAASCRSLQFWVICTKRRFSASVINIHHKVYQELRFFLSEQGDNKQYAEKMINDGENNFIFLTLCKSHEKIISQF